MKNLWALLLMAFGVLLTANEASADSANERRQPLADKMARRREEAKRE